MIPNPHKLSCEHEPEVVVAIKSGIWTEGLQQHFVQCDACSEAAFLSEALSQSLASSAPLEVPSAGLLWWKAEQRQRRESLERALRPIQWAERAVVASALAASVAGLAWTGQSTPLLGWAAAAAVVLLASTTGAIWLVVSASKR